MKISLCMPVFGADRAKVFCDAVYSILLQGFDDFELVAQDGNLERPLVEDDRARQVIALLGDRFSYARGRDLGIFDGLNKALRRSTGEILYFMCSDDLLCPGALIAVNEAFERERFGGAFWLYGQTISADYTGKTLGIDGRPITLDDLKQHNQIGQPAVFWNRRLMELAGMFDVRYRYAADYELWLRFWKRCEPLFLNQTLGIFRHHDDQFSNVNAAKLEVEARMVAWRHTALGGLLDRARNLLVARRAYPDGFPESVN